ncbi:MAG: hypothetical protein RML36_01380 [Anaerolineae bacterium]|nr:hypothetical protein [Anaerolineae bacterium]MDW8098120.1 hypothetical protein [Anaerolineae bacterium]
MSDRKPVGPTWKPNPKEIVVITNISQKNLAFKLPTGYFRLDVGRSQMVEASFLDLPAIKALVEAGQIQVTKANRKR